MKKIVLFLLLPFLFFSWTQASSIDSASHSSIYNMQTLVKQEEKQFCNSREECYQYLFFLTFGISGIFFFLLMFYRNKMFLYKNRLAEEEKAYKKRELATANKEELISYVSHELRTPMSAITGLIHLVLESDLNGLQRDYLKKVEKASTYMLSLLNDILDLSKIEARKLTLEKREFNLNDIVHYIYNIIAVQAKENSIDVRVYIDNRVPSQIIGDSLRLGQILINLMANAVKFTKEGEVALEIKRIKNFENRVVLEFIVSDSGIGMTQEQLKELFNSFYQAEQSISREYGGTGLGLYISKNLIELMGGKISVESKKNVGTTFRFTLSFELKDSQEKRQYRLPSEKLLGKKILLVDSYNKDALSLLQGFNYFNYQVENIPSSQKITEAFLDESYDIIVINLQNLDEYALEVMQKLKAENDIKIVILSELHSSLNELLLHDIEIDAYLKPPITTQSVLELITELYMPKKTTPALRKEKYIQQLKNFKDKKILIADDHEINHKILEGMLKGTGIELFFVHNGEEAIALLETKIKIDLILMDINMPVMNGFETAIEICKRYGKIPILALSADMSEETVAKSKRSCIHGNLLKPINLDEFYIQIIDTFERSESF